MAAKLGSKSKKIVKGKKTTVKVKSKNTAKKIIKKVTPKAKKPVLAIPKGYHSITPYLIMDNAAKAIEFYKKAFAAKEIFRMDKPGGKIAHAELKIGDAKIMLADEYPDMGARAPKSFGGSPVSIHLYIKNVDRVVAQAVAAGGKLIRPVNNMFYGDRSGIVDDPCGHTWCISTHVEDVTPAQLRKRAAAMQG